MTEPQSLFQLISATYDTSLKIVGLCVLVMFLWAGIKLMFFGDRSGAISIIQDAVIGAVILFSAVVILNTINPDLAKEGGKMPSLNTGTQK